MLYYSHNKEPPTIVLVIITPVSIVVPFWGKSVLNHTTRKIKLIKQKRNYNAAIGRTRRLVIEGSGLRGSAELRAFFLGFGA